MSTNVNKVVQYPYQQAFDKLYHCIANSGCSISNADLQHGIIKFSTPISFSDWGYNFVVRISSLGSFTTQINFQGDTKFGIDLFGFGTKKIDKIMKNY